MGTKQKKVVLAYSGGLDTSVMLKWLIEESGYDVVAFCADLGQGEDFDAVHEKAKSGGACSVWIENLREVFVSEYVFPMLRANAASLSGTQPVWKYVRCVQAKRIKASG